MRPIAHYALLLALGIGALALTAQALWNTTTTFAQQDQTIISASDCGVSLSQFWLNASNACVGKPFGYVCNGGISPQAEPVGVVSTSLAGVGALVEIGVVDALHTPNIQSLGDIGGITWLRVAETDSPLRFSALLVGDVNVRDTTPAGFASWQNFVVETLDPTERCETAPLSSFIVQSLPNESSRVVINSVSLDVSGTAVVQTQNSETHFMSIAGTLGVLTGGQRVTVYAGQEVTVGYEPGDFSNPVSSPSLPDAFRPERVDHLPVVLFDFPVVIPQAGIATTLGAVNLRTAPTTDAAVLIQANSGERLTVLGRNPEGDWYHVRMADGQSGWMFAELLGGDIGDIRNVYVETPVPLQRMGDLGQVAQVIAPNGVAMRIAPDISFVSITTLPFGQETTLLNRSPYSPWVKVDVSGTVGWVPLIAMETRAIIDALPIDYDVPPPPEPTRIPGSFGNAFPDPNCFPNCG